MTDRSSASTALRANARSLVSSAVRRTAPTIWSYEAVVRVSPATTGGVGLLHICGLLEARSAENALRVLTRIAIEAAGARKKRFVAVDSIELI